MYSFDSSSPKKWLSAAEIAVFIVVLWVLFAAIIPIFIRIGAYQRNTTRISDIKHITQQVKTYYTKNWEYPTSLREIERWGVGAVPKDPSTLAYCTWSPEYSSWNYQYFSCVDCESVWPFKTYLMRNIVQVWALMERENKRWERNSWNWRAKYKEWETSNCAANAIRWAWTHIDWVKWNWIWWTWEEVMNIVTNIVQPDYEPWFNSIIASERK